MKTKGLSVAAAVLMILVVVAAAAAQPGLTLRYNYTAGEVDNYLMKGTVAGVMKMPDAGEVPITADLNGRLTVKVAAVSDQGVASQEMTLERMEITTDAMGMQAVMVMEAGKLTVTVNGQPVEMPQNVPGMEAIGKPIKAKVDARGRVLQMDLTPLGDLAAGFDPTMLQEMNIVFPEGPVSVGDSWSNEMKIPLNVVGQKMELGLNFTYTFAGIQQYKGREVAKLDLKGTARMGAGGDSPDRVKQTFSGYELFDHVAGRQVYDKIKLEQATAEVGAPGQPAATMTMTGDFEVTIE